MKIAKVIKILNNNTIVINKGLEDGVKDGDICLVYNIGEELFDPDTNESLGEIEYVKGKGKVIHAQEKISTIESIETKKTRIVKKPNTSLGMTIRQMINTEEESFESEILPFKDVELNDFVKKIR